MVLGVIEAPVALDAHAVNADALFLEHLYNMDHALKLGRAPDVELIVIEFRVRGVLLRKAEHCLDNLVSVLFPAEGLYPSQVTVSSLFGNNLIEHVPGIYPALEMSADGLYVTSEGLHQFVMALGVAFGVVPEEIRGLVMPAESVSHSEHPMLVGKVHIPVGALPVPYVRPWMQ